MALKENNSTDFIALNAVIFSEAMVFKDTNSSQAIALNATKVFIAAICLLLACYSSLVICFKCFKDNYFLVTN